MACAALRLPRVSSSRAALGASPLLRSAHVYRVVLVLVLASAGAKKRSSVLHIAEDDVP